MSPADVPPGAANRAVLTRAASSRTCATERVGRIARRTKIATANSTTIPSTPLSEIEGMESPLSNPCSKDHVTNVTDYPARLRITERSIVDKSFGHTRWPRPSSYLPRRIPVRHVDMKVRIASDLEKRDLTIVRQRTLGLEAPDGRFQCLNVSRPGVGEECVPAGDRHTSTPATVL
jgi:hypothetical protein